MAHMLLWACMHAPHSHFLNGEINCKWYVGTPVMPWPHPTDTHSALRMQVSR